MTLQKAVDQLLAVKLCASIDVETWGDKSEYIRGAEYEEDAGGITLWQGAFQIIPEDGQYLVRLAGIIYPDNIDEEFIFPTLQEAVDCIIYKKRIELRKYWFMGFEPLKRFL